jgi:hypothetical protein
MDYTTELIELIHKALESGMGADEIIDLVNMVDKEVNPEEDEE